MNSEMVLLTFQPFFRNKGSELFTRVPYAQWTTYPPAPSMMVFFPESNVFTFPPDGNEPEKSTYFRLLFSFPCLYCELSPFSLGIPRADDDGGDDLGAAARSAMARTSSYILLYGKQAGAF